MWADRAVTGYVMKYRVAYERPYLAIQFCVHYVSLKSGGAMELAHNQLICSYLVDMLSITFMWVYKQNTIHSKEHHLIPFSSFIYTPDSSVSFIIT